MTIRRPMLLLWGVAALTLAGTGLLTHRALASAIDLRWAVPDAAAGVPAVRADLGDLTRQVVDADPFRFDRRPASLPFGARPHDAAAAPRYTARTPTIAGIVGPPWRAAIEGMPGREGSVLVAAGDTVGGWRVVSVRRDSVVIQALDTTWRLPVRTP